MKTATTPAAHNPANTRLVLILIGVVTALISLVALGLELRISLPLVSGNQISSGWFSTVAGQTIQWFQGVMVTLI